MRLRFRLRTLMIAVAAVAALCPLTIEFVRLTWLLLHTRTDAELAASMRVEAAKWRQLAAKHPNLAKEYQTIAERSDRAAEQLDRRAKSVELLNRSR